MLTVNKHGMKNFYTAFSLTPTICNSIKNLLDWQNSVYMENWDDSLVLNHIFHTILLCIRMYILYVCIPYAQAVYIYILSFYNDVTRLVYICFIYV